MMNKSLQEQGLKVEEYRADETDDAFKTTVNEIQHEEVREEHRTGFIFLFFFFLLIFPFNSSLPVKAESLILKQPFEETEKATASTSIRERVAAEDTSFEDSDQVSVENKTIKESFPQEFNGKDVEDSANKLEAENQGEESNFGSGKLEVTTPRDEVSLQFTLLTLAINIFSEKYK